MDDEWNEIMERATSIDMLMLQREKQRHKKLWHESKLKWIIHRLFDDFLGGNDFVIYM